MGIMVESNHDEERLARVESMVEALQRETAALKAVTGRLTIWCDTHDVRTKKTLERPKDSNSRRPA